MKLTRRRLFSGLLLTSPLAAAPFLGNPFKLLQRLFAPRNATYSELLCKFPQDQVDSETYKKMEDDFSVWHGTLHNYFMQRVPGLIVPHTKPAIQLTEVRELKELKGEKAALVFNNVCSWEGSPRARKAALEWAKRHLASGGVYVDENAGKIPCDMDYTCFELLHKDERYTIFRKI